jgi:hypothetical protein
MSLFQIKTPKNARRSDPLEDRRSGEDRRTAYDLDYFQEGGAERRNGPERRSLHERRDDCQRVSEWSSVCPPDES